MRNTKTRREYETQKGNTWKKYVMEVFGKELQMVGHSQGYGEDEKVYIYIIWGRERETKGEEE